MNRDIAACCLCEERSDVAISYVLEIFGFLDIFLSKIYKNVLY